MHSIGHGKPGMDHSNGLFLTRTISSGRIMRTTSQFPLPGMLQNFGPCPSHEEAIQQQSIDNSAHSIHTTNTRA